MNNDDDLLMISALQHLLFCERQCALIHVEQLWIENLFTVRGEIMHKKAHDGAVEFRDGIRIERGIPLRSNKLGLIGRADVVEFHKKKKGDFINSKVPLLPFPVEYKLGKPKENSCNEVQLCAQAICLEEMLTCVVPEGALFYGKTKRRKNVVFTCDLRRLTEKTARRLHEIVNNGITPRPLYEKYKCDNCSLLNLCVPKISQKHSVNSYLEKIINEETS